MPVVTIELRDVFHRQDIPETEPEYIRRGDELPGAMLALHDRAAFERSLELEPWAG
jgi:hypothetical protein